MASLIGDSNFLKVKEARIEGGKSKVTLPDGTVFAEAAMGEASEIMVRPQAFRLAEAGEPSLAADVKDVTFLGDTTSLLLETSWGQQLWMRGPARQLGGINRGSRIRTTWQASECHVFA